jgi:hypothetical protein
MSLHAPRSPIDAAAAEQAPVNEHCALAKEVVLLRTAADTIARCSPEGVLDHAERALILLERVASHVRAEQEPRCRIAFRDHRPCCTDLDRVEVDRLTRRLGELKTLCARDHAASALEEIREVLYELHALTRLHFAGELIDAAGGAGSTAVDEQRELIATR